MTTKFVQPGDCITLTAPTGGVVAGLAYLIGNLLVVALATVAQTLPFVGCAEGVHSVVKAGTQAWTEGAIVYWDNTAKNFTTVATANYRAGVAVAAVGAGAGETTGLVRLNGIGVTAVGGAAP